MTQRQSLTSDAVAERLNMEKAATGELQYVALVLLDTRPEPDTDVRGVILIPRDKDVVLHTEIVWSTLSGNGLDAAKASKLRALGYPVVLFQAMTEKAKPPFPPFDAYGEPFDAYGEPRETGRSPSIPLARKKPEFICQECQGIYSYDLAMTRMSMQENTNGAQYHPEMFCTTSCEDLYLQKHKRYPVISSEIPGGNTLSGVCNLGKLTIPEKVDTEWRLIQSANDSENEYEADREIACADEDDVRNVAENVFLLLPHEVTKLLHGGKIPLGKTHTLYVDRPTKTLEDVAKARTVRRTTKEVWVGDPNDPLRQGRPMAPELEDSKVPLTPPSEVESAMRMMQEEGITFHFIPRREVWYFHGPSYATGPFNTFLDALVTAEDQIIRRNEYTKHAT